MVQVLLVVPGGTSVTAGNFCKESKQLKAMKILFWKLTNKMGSRFEEDYSLFFENLIFFCVSVILFKLTLHAQAQHDIVKLATYRH